MNDTLKLQLHPSFAYQNYFVGRDKIPLLVIDNFVEEPQSLIRFCVESNTFNNADSFYPGLRMPAPTQYIQAIHYYLGGLIEQTYGLKKNEWLGGRSLYSMVVTPPADMNEQQSVPHVDSFKRGDLACVHFLCGPSHGGTSLYRHKKTGFEIVDKDRIEHYNQVAISEGVLDAHPKSYMNGSDDFYEQIACVDAMFNRLVIYPANVLHSGNIAPTFTFDPNPTTGRLTLNSFIFGKASA
jgi:hypothetical protein